MFCRACTPDRVGTPYKNHGGACRKFSKNTLKGTTILFDGRGSNEI